MIRISGSLLLVLSCSSLLAAQTSQAKGGASSKLAHGRYLVEQVGLCTDCHTPHDDRGQLLKDKQLQGAPIGFKPLGQVPVWADKAPPIAGLPGWDDAAAINFFTTGIGPNGSPARPPMPPYRFSRQDAEAVTAYLRSVGQQNK